jgi:hypothetical protein
MYHNGQARPGHSPNEGLKYLKTIKIAQTRFVMMVYLYTGGLASCSVLLYAPRARCCIPAALCHLTDQHNFCFGYSRV